jgi:hypothetical protein
MGEMSSVSMNDNPYAYFSKRLEELEDEYQKNTRRATDRRDEEVASLREKHAVALEENSQKSEESVDRLRNKMQEDLADVRRASDDERSRLKQQTYNHLGKFNGLEADVLKEQLTDMTRAYEVQRDRYKDELATLEKSQERALDEHAKQTEHRLEHAAAQARNVAGEASEKNKEEQNELNKALRVRLENQANELANRANEDLRFGAEQRESQVEEIRRNYDRLAEKSQEQQDLRVNKINEAHDRKMHEAIARQRNSQSDQITNYESQLKVLHGSAKDAADAKAQGRAAAVQELEGDHRNTVNNITSSYERQIENARLDQEAVDDQYRHKLSERIREKDAHYGEMLTDQAKDNHQYRRELEDNYARDRDALIAARKLDQQMASQRLELEESRSSQERAEALEQQAASYKSTLENVRDQDREKIKVLEQAIQTKATSSDTSDIPPAAEAKLRATYERAMEKKLAAEQLRNRESEESIRNSYTSRMNDLVAENKSRETRLVQDVAGENQSTRALLAYEVQAAHDARLETTRDLEGRREKGEGKLHALYQKEIERQHRNFEDLLGEIKSDANLRVQTERQENEFRLRTQQQESIAKTNSIIREYENKIALQKEEFETAMDDLQQEFSKMRTESDKNNRLQAETIQRNYEQRIAELESQHKQRERTLEENHMDQLEKVKRANALLIRKKS